MVSNVFPLPFSVIAYSKIIYLFIAYPEHTSDYNATQQSLRVVAGTSITLPCHVRVSALGRYTVNWRTLNPLNSDINVRPEPHNSDYSLTLTDLEVEEHSCKRIT